MMILRTLYQFEWLKFRRSSKVTFPLVILLAYLALAYSVGPLHVRQSYSAASMVLFLLMLALGVLYDDANYDLTEQSILVKLADKKVLYLSKLVLMAVLSFGGALICTFLPLIINLVRGSKLFEQGPRIGEVCFALFLFWLIALSGASAGLLANRRTCKSRSFAILAGILFGVLVLAKGSMIRQMPVFRYILWVFPPVYELNIGYTAGEAFSLGNVWAQILWMIAYIALEMVVYVYCMRKKRFA